jgi:DNA modification methylase
MSRVDTNNTIRGFIFACTKRTEQDCLKSLIFGTDKIFAPVMIRVKSGDLLFLQNIETHLIHGVFRAVSYGGQTIDSKIWGGKYPFQVKVEPVGELHTIEDSVLGKNGIIHNKLIVGRRLISIIDTYSEKENLKNGQINKEYDVIRTSVNPDETDVEIPIIEATTLWDFPRQNYGITKKGNNKYSGVTPALVIFNLIWRYTEIGELIVDPMCGSGTTLDVCKEEKREAVGLDICPPTLRKDEVQSDARKIPLKDSSADMVFVDSPYGDNLKYNEKMGCLCNISSERDEFYDELEKIMIESKRVLKKGKIIAWLIGDQWLKKEFTPVGLKVYERLSNHFHPIEIISVSRKGQSSNTRLWYSRARRNNFYLRGFKYLIIAKKVSDN